MKKHMTFYPFVFIIYNTLIVLVSFPLTVSVKLVIIGDDLAPLVLFVIKTFQRVIIYSTLVYAKRCKQRLIPSLVTFSVKCRMNFITVQNMT